MLKFLILYILILFQITYNKQPINDRSKEIIAQKLDSLFHEYYEKQGFNGNVLIACDGNVVYKNTFGYCDLKTKKPLSIESTFQIASVTKQFTAMAIMMLYEKGKLKFTDTVQKFFPEFPYKGITIHHLLAHRSGLPNYMRFAKTYWKNKRKLMTNNDLMKILIDHKPKALFKPDEKYKYSNTGYAVLACIIEKVSKRPYSTFLKENIFDRLKMYHTFVYPSKEVKDKYLDTKGYEKNKRRAVDDYLCGVVGDKGIYSTVEDLFKWDQALYTEELVKQQTLQEAFSPISYDQERKNNYGYGWRIENFEDGSKVVYHAGWWRGYNSLFVRKLDDKTSIIVLSNRANYSIGEIGDLLKVIDSTRTSISIENNSN